MRKPISRDRSISEVSNEVSCLAIKLAKARAMFSACVRAFLFVYPNLLRRAIVEFRTAPFGMDSKVKWVGMAERGSNGRKVFGSGMSVCKRDENL